MKKLNKIDLLVGIALVGLLAIGLIGYFKPKAPVLPDVYLTGRVAENAADIKDEVQARVGKAVYFDGTKKAVTLVSVSEKDGQLYLVVKGPGKIEDSRYIFNGISLATGQKAEVHSDFQAKLIITDVQNVQPR